LNPSDAAGAGDTLSTRRYAAAAIDTAHVGQGVLDTDQAPPIPWLARDEVARGES
jgi:hypothetical protein